MEGICGNCGGYVGVECGDSWAYHEPWCQTDSTCPSCDGKKTKPKCALCDGVGHIERSKKRDFNSNRLLSAFEKADRLLGKDRYNGYTRRIRRLM